MKIEAILQSVGPKDARGVCLAGVRMNNVRAQTIFLQFGGDIGSLASAISAAFGYPSVEIVYIDEDGDKISLGKSHEELKEAIRCLGNGEPITTEVPEESKVGRVEAAEDDSQNPSASEPAPVVNPKQRAESEKRAKQRENVLKRRENLGQRIADIDKKIQQLQQKKEELEGACEDVEFRLESLDAEDQIQFLPPAEQRAKRLERLKIEKATLLRRLEGPNSHENLKRLQERLAGVSGRIETIETNIATQQERQKQNRIAALRKQHANVTERLEATPEDKQGRLQARLDDIALKLADLEQEVTGETPFPSRHPLNVKEQMKQEREAQKQAEKQERQAQKQAQKQQAQQAKVKAQLEAQQVRLESKLRAFQEKKDKTPKMMQNEKIFQERLRLVCARLQQLECE